MHREGHIGFSLIVLAIVMHVLHFWDLKTAVIALGFSTFPDIDLKMEIAHRRWTHSIIFAVIVGLVFGYVTKLFGLGFERGFWGAFSGVVLHIAGDLLTYQPFAPFYPISKRKIALGLFKSDNVLVNKFMLICGFLIFVYFYAEDFGILLTFPKNPFR